MAALAIATLLLVVTGCTSSLKITDICPSTEFIVKRNRAFQSVKVAISDSFYSRDARHYFFGYHHGYYNDYSVYYSLVTRFNMSASSEGFKQYLSAAGEIATESIKYCESADIPLTRITKTQISTLIKQFTTTLDRKNIHQARKIFGSLVCINEANRIRHKRQFVPTRQLIDFYEVTFMGRRLPGLIFEYYVNDTQSLAFVVDDTGSMGGEISYVKNILKSFIASNRWQPITYILGTFNDPVTGV